MGVTKKYLKSKPICKVTFSIPAEAVKSAKTVYLVGEFNDWSIDTVPMKKLKNGSFKITLDLEVGREYQFRYLIDETNWENDWDADNYVYSPFGDCENSVVIV